MTVTQCECLAPRVVLNKEVGADIVFTQIDNTFFLCEGDRILTRDILGQNELRVICCAIESRKRFSHIACIYRHCAFLDDIDIFYIFRSAIVQCYRSTFRCRTRTDCPVGGIYRTVCHFNGIEHYFRRITYFYFYIVCRHGKTPSVISHGVQVKVRFNCMSSRGTIFHYHPWIAFVVEVGIALYGIAVRYDHRAVFGSQRVEGIHTAIEGVCTNRATTRIGTRSVEGKELTIVDSYRTRCIACLVVLDTLIQTATNDIIHTIGEYIPNIDILKNDCTFVASTPSADTVYIQKRAIADSDCFSGLIIPHVEPTAVLMSVQVYFTFRTGEDQIGIEILCYQDFGIRRVVKVILRRRCIGCGQVDCVRIFSAYYCTLDCLRAGVVHLDRCSF